MESAARAVDTFLQVVERLEAGFVDRVHGARLVEAGLRALLAVDPRWEIAVERQRFVIGLADSPARSFEIASPPSPPLARTGVGAALWQVLDYARQHSPALAALAWDEIGERLIEGALDSLSPRPALYAADSEENWANVGIEYGEYGQEVLIVHVLPGSPAAGADILPGMLLTGVDGTALRGLRGDRIRDLLGGPLDSEVEITVQTPGGASRTHRLRRARPGSARLELHWLEAGIAYMRPGALSRHSDASLSYRLDDFEHGRSIGALVLDLRQHTGGVLGAALQLADRFLERGLLLTLDGRSPAHYHATPGGSWRDVPVVVLIDGATAAGAEALAAALADNERAVLIGTASWGMGRVRVTAPIGDERTLYFDHARMVRPNGTAIEANGVLPDVCVTDTPDCRQFPLIPVTGPDDEVVRQAVALLRAAMAHPRPDRRGGRE